MGGHRDGTLSSLDRSTTSSSSGTTVVEREVKVVVAGPAKCGKTSLIDRFVNDQFREAYVPTNFKKYTTNDFVNNTTIQYSIWDTSGSPAYDSIRPLAYSDASVFLLCFRISEPDSFHAAINKWLPEIRSHCPTTPIVFCGCASDLRNDVETIARLSQSNYGEPIAAEYATRTAELIRAMGYVETSSMYGDDKGLYEVFALAAKAALAHQTINTIYENAIADVKNNNNTSGSSGHLSSKNKHNSLNCMRLGGASNNNNSSSSNKKEAKKRQQLLLQHQQDLTQHLDNEMFIYQGMNNCHMSANMMHSLNPSSTNYPILMTATTIGAKTEFKSELKHRAKNCSIM